MPLPQLPPQTRPTCMIGLAIVWQASSPRHGSQQTPTCDAELGDGSTLYRFGSETEAQVHADRSAPSSVPPQPEQPAEQEAASSPEGAAETSSAVSKASLPEPPPAEEEREEVKQHSRHNSRQTASSQNSIQLSEEELSHMKVTTRRTAPLPLTCRLMYCSPYHHAHGAFRALHTCSSTC